MRLVERIKQLRNMAGRAPGGAIKVHCELLDQWLKEEEKDAAIMVSRGTPDTPAAMAAELEAHLKRLNDPHLPWGYDQALALSRSLETAIAVLRSGA